MTKLGENFVDGLLRISHHFFFSQAGPGFLELTAVEEAGQRESGRYLHTNSTIAMRHDFISAIALLSVLR